MKILRIIAMIAKTPQVSIFFRPFIPSPNKRVIISQKIIPQYNGLIFPGRIADKLSPSPTRYARSAE